jgi:hypothetical protein
MGELGVGSSKWENSSLRSGADACDALTSLVGSITSSLVIMRFFATKKA